jgi:hypothetical protein
LLVVHSMVSFLEDAHETTPLRVFVGLVPKTAGGTKRMRSMGANRSKG